MQRTRLSSKGQVTVPKNIRDSRAWEAGMEFTVEATPHGVLLRPVGSFPLTELAQVVGCLPGKHKLLRSDQMQRAIGKEVKRRYHSGRY